MCWANLCQNSFSILLDLRDSKICLSFGGNLLSKKRLETSVQFSHLVASESLWSHELHHARLLYPSSTLGACSNSRPSSRWYHLTIPSFEFPVSSCSQSFPASGSFQMRQFFALGGQSIGVSASTLVLPMDIQDWIPLGLTGLISLQSKGLSRVFFNTTVWKHQFFSAQISLWSSSHLYMTTGKTIALTRWTFVGR